MTLYSTSTFDEKIIELSRKKKYQYIHVAEDIKEEFRNRNFDELVSMNDTLKIFENERYVLKKFRIKNSSQKKSKSAGYRVIVLLILDVRKVVFLYCYPKTGHFAQQNINHSVDIPKFISTFVAEKDSLNVFFVSEQIDVQEIIIS